MCVCSWTTCCVCSPVSLCVYWHGFGVWLFGVLVLKFRGCFAQAVVVRDNMFGFSGGCSPVC